MASGIRHDDLRRNNRLLVLSSVRRMGQASRTEIASVTGFSQSTISAISAGLIAEGALREIEAEEPAAVLKRGRPQVGLALDPRAGAVVVATLALNHLTAALLDYAGNTIAERERRLDTLGLSAAALEEEVTGTVAELIEEATTRAAGPVLRVVLAVQGITDRAGREMVWTPITPWTGLGFAGLIERRTGVPTGVENDCSMIAAALMSASAIRRQRDFAVVLLSHGIGMGIVLDGRIFSGTHSSGAEFGHLMLRPGGALCRCGKHGCVEAYAGSYAIARAAAGDSEMTVPPSDINAADIARLAAAARNGSPLEQKAFDQAGEAIGLGLGSLFALVDPLPVTFVGANTQAFDLMKPGLRRGLKATAGGARAGNIAFALEPDEMPLIRQGSALRALHHLDEEIFSPGVALAG
ncbi:MAG: ROK family protein [Methylobacterium mesophilicum]|nr:ROK family protein [Methylobacterium mesophilicum]